MAASRDPGACPVPCGGFLHTRALEPVRDARTMDPQTLPAEAKAIYDEIRQAHKVGFESLRLGPVHLHLLTVTDLESLLDGKDPLEDPASFPFWVRLWEAAIVLAEYLAQQEFAPGTTLLELGAGLGAPGLAAAKRGCRVTLTDYEGVVLQFQRVSAAANGLADVQVRPLDWLDPPPLDRYDLIVGAEILFREEFFDPLLAVMDQALAPGGQVLMAHDAERQSLRPFLERAQDRYRIGVKRQRLRSLDRDREILLTRMQRR